MIAEAGLAALWFAGALAALQLVMAAIGIARGREDVAAAVRPVAIVQGLLALLAMALLIELFLDSDMSVKLVVENSHSASRGCTSSPVPGGITRARCCSG